MLNEKYVEFLKSIDKNKYNFVDDEIFDKYYQMEVNLYEKQEFIQLTDEGFALIPIKNIESGRYFATRGSGGEPLYKERLNPGTFEPFDGEVKIGDKYYYKQKDGKNVAFVVSENTQETVVAHLPKILTSSGKIDKISVDSRNYLRVSKRGGDQIPLEVELWSRYSSIGSNNNLPLNTKEAYRIRGSFSIDDCLRQKTSDREGTDVLASLKEDVPNLREACKELLDIDRSTELSKKKAGENYGKYFIETTIQETGGLECFDIMGVNDCLTLFSVCDPVMCPVSRFNSGGSWRVDNVVSTGIFGSIFLGNKLWDFKRIPPEIGICIPGIDAGLKNIRSLAEGYQQCLIARKEKGENIGICDTIRSIGYCKIAWREGITLINLGGGIVDKVLASIFGGNNKASGGGEYAYFQSNIKKTGEFIDFFTKEYATTYFNAYRGASTDEIGEELCNAAIYGKIPGKGNLIDQLTKPEGPVQFTAWFTEVPHSEIGGDVYSDYEVYYHIYAGEDRERVRYVVYLKDLDDLSRVENPLYITKTTGYIARGDFVDETWRDTKQTGYDELCIVIDNQESCGFGRVSSDLLVDYLEDKNLDNTIQDQIKNQPIKNEKECTGESTIFTQSPLTKEGAGSIIDAFYPGLINNGLIRVCSKDDPGKGVGASWVKVGTCGTNELGQDLGSCWLSKQSYTDSLSKYDINRTKEAEKFFQKISELGLIDDEDTMKSIKGLIETRKALINSIDLTKNDEEYKNSKKKEFIDIVNWFVEVDSKTINPNLEGKINYEIGETYYELAVYLKKEEIQLKQSETSKVEQEKTESVDISEVESNRINYVVSYFYYYNKWDGNNWFIKDTSGRPLEGYIKNFESYDIGLLNFVGRFLQSGYTKITLECQNYIKELDISQLSSRNSQSIINWIKVNSKDCLKTVVTSKDITSRNKVVEECKIEYNRKLVPTDYWFTFSNGNWYYGTVSILGLSLDVTIVNAQSKVDKEFYVPIIYNLFNPVKKDLSKSNFENDLFNPDEKSIGEPDFEDGLNFLIDYAKNIENKDQLIIHKGENKLKLEGDSLIINDIIKFCKPNDYKQYIEDGGDIISKVILSSNEINRDTQKVAISFVLDEDAIQSEDLPFKEDYLSDINLNIYDSNNNLIYTSNKPSWNYPSYYFYIYDGDIESIDKFNSGIYIYKFTSKYKNGRNIVEEGKFSLIVDSVIRN